MTNNNPLSNNQASIVFLNYLLDSARDVLPASCGSSNMLIDTIYLDNKLSDAKVALS